MIDHPDIAWRIFLSTFFLDMHNCTTFATVVQSAQSSLPLWSSRFFRSHWTENCFRPETTDRGDVHHMRRSRLWWLSVGGTWAFRWAGWAFATHEASQGGLLPWHGPDTQETKNRIQPMSIVPHWVAPKSKYFIALQYWTHLKPLKQNNTPIIFCLPLYLYVFLFLIRLISPFVEQWRFIKASTRCGVDESFFASRLVVSC